MKLAKPSRCKDSPELEGIGQEHTAFHLIEQARLHPRLCSHMLRKHSAGSMKSDHDEGQQLEQQVVPDQVDPTGF